MEKVLDDIDAAVEAAPSYEAKEKQISTALAKLSEEERGLLGIKQHLR
jgi:hypothetical protein